MTTPEFPQQQQERWERTTAICRQRLQTNPGDASALYQLGLVAREMGAREDALELFRRSLEADMSNEAAVVHLADLLGEMGRVDEAAEFYRAALETAPRQPELHIKLGNVLGAAGKWEEALRCQEKAVKLSPQSPSALGNLGVAQMKNGDFTAAISSFRLAKRLAPHVPEIMANLGGCLVQAGRPEEAVEVLSNGVKKHPECASAFSNLAAAQTALGRVAEATAAAWKAVELDGISVDALNNLGIALKGQGEYTQAINCFVKARELQPSGYLAYNNIGTTLTEMGQSTEALEGLRRARELNPRSPLVFSNYLLTLNYQSDIPRETIYAEHRKFDELFGRSLTEASEAHGNAREPERRLRIGYVSADFRDHPVVQFFEPMLATHNPREFEIFCYANQHANDAVTQRLRGKAHHWRNVAGLNDAELDAQIRRDGIDILVDLSGHTAGNRLLAFARKPAPIQVTMIGYMQTSGLGAMDYRITDARMDVPGISDTLSTEKLVRLEAGAATFSPPPDAPAPTPPPVEQNGYVTFGSFNNLAKVTPEVISAWGEILQRVPDSRLLVAGRGGIAVTSALEEQGIAKKRLIFIERQPMAAYLALHGRVDLLLDTFPYNGGTTNLLAIWMGVPFITATGGNGPGRAGASLLEALGLGDFIASSPEDYVALAVARSAELPRLAALRNALRDSLAPLLGNGEHFTRELEAEYRAMWKRWVAAESSC